MQNFAILIILLALVQSSCTESQEALISQGPYFAKEMFNSEWKKQGIGPEEWLYRMTVIDVPANSQAQGLAEGHWLHPEVIRWEITKDLIIGWRTHASIINADHELNAGAKRFYRGAAVVAFAITQHVDVNDLPWYERRFIKIDLKTNLVSKLQRTDEDKGIYSLSMNNHATHLIDDSWVANPNRMRIGTDYIDFVVRYPVHASMASQQGEYGLAYKGDTASSVIDIRHFFGKKPKSDYVPLPYPDYADQQHISQHSAFKKKDNWKQIPINKRFGLFRTNYDGKKVYTPSTGSSSDKKIINATIFNIWAKIKDENGKVIPIEDRETKPIIYYANVLHPEDLNAASIRVANQWNKALKEAVFYAQPHKYKNINDVPSIFILRPNNCHITNIKHWLDIKRNDLKDIVQTQAKVSLSLIQDQLEQANDLSLPIKFNDRQTLEINAKRKLENICSALEFYTKNSLEPFIYQRPGDLRFNLLNLIIDNKTTNWSGYGPMFSDPITGEIFVATANINMKYIDLRAQAMARQIELLKDKKPGLQAVFGSQSMSFQNKSIDKSRVKKIQNRLMTWKKDVGDLDHHMLSFDPLGILSVNKKDSPINALMDPIKFVDDISLGIALKFVHLSLDERFIKIRQAIYEAVALHEIGHNLGLRHNMAAAADAINYGKDFWRIEQLPSDMKAAIAIVNDQYLKKQLQECIDEEKITLNQLNKIYASEHITTQDCLQQKNGMYASIMDYHANALADINGLGLYDRAAIKWAYGRVVEVFPRDNLKVNPDNVNLAHWLKFNDYRQIPKAMLKNFDAIHIRQHKKVVWDDKKSLTSFPSNAVPYLYCDDLNGIEGPRCLANDFGPDMTSLALWLKSRFSKQYLLTHFAKNESWTQDSQEIQSTLLDIDIMERFTNIMRWYYRYLIDEPDFKGSYREKDFLKALAIGINHFAHVIGLPQSGAHISAPVWEIETQNSLDIMVDRLKASNLLIPFNKLSTCSARSVTARNSSGELHGRFGYRFVEVPLGIGRPLYPGTSKDLEEKFILYSGTALAKKIAVYLLLAPMNWEKSAETLENNDLLSMSWYKIFPQAVTKIYQAIISEDYEELGTFVESDGSLVMRDIIDENTLELKHINAKATLIPAIDESLPAFAMSTAIAFNPVTSDQESNLVKSMKIFCHGCNDDMEYSKTISSARRISFKHLSGVEYKAMAFSNTDSIGAKLLEKANFQKQRYIRLSECLEDEEIRKNDPICQCVKIIERISYDSWVCCDQDNKKCNGPKLAQIGEQACSIKDLKIRQTKSKDRLNAMVGFIDALRHMIKKAGY
jgi:hypothetical protein